ncbi:S8 family serine peptidase [Streptomyces sp. TRM66268-LWL]|uniref:S8 family serine peptidase n=1 Tax=Streptomyces polyasparticus TaxID=2767826 RepID=A0ABR7S974_9ACTN|nr:S8 family serine peptidase [Streptomyces polyasparticus]MBC9712027.1 S8 family serine peptidase [Streptomyces polyasparticus]
MRRLVYRPALVATAATAVIAATMGATTLPATADGAAPASAKAPHKPTHRVQLITGDTAEVTGGKVTGFRPAPGREDIPVRIADNGGRSLVIPLDAERLIAEGVLDQRLFDAELLAAPAARKAYKKGLKVIVGYRGAAATARAEVSDAGGTEVRRDLKSLNAEAVTTPAKDLPELWNSLTARNGLAATTGVRNVWLDAPVKARLDVSIPQIGADKAWQAGYDGKGVKVAVLDTGVDETHPDLVGQQLVEKNFSASADTKDRQGHGTHVASTVAGTGAKSGGKFKGVAPGAGLIDGKVLDDTGSGEESDIIEAIEWAVGEGADIVSMSLGGPDAPGVEPLEEAVNTYTENNGVLFTVAAGNEGPGASTVGSPGAADGALTVGAVDDNDAMASFSSRGPRVGDGAIKPDVTAPGVDITAASAPGNSIAAEVGENPEGYMTISGTSMATPHVAGAAAILKQQHPDWKAAELKGVLTGSTKDGGFTAFEQGAGRIQVDKAIAQGVYASPTSLSLGKAAWPHEDDAPIDRKVTYRNTGTSDVTLDLSVAGKGPKGEAAPAGMFGVAPAQLTVPAGGTAEATFTADTSVEAADGQYSAAITATGGGQSVRTAAAVEREVASYTVSLEQLGRDGKAAAHFQTYVTALTGVAAGQEFTFDEASSSTELRLPVGEYSVQSMVIADRADLSKGLDWIAQPRLKVDGDTKVTFDARTAKPVDITVPDAKAVPEQAYAAYEVQGPSFPLTIGWRLESYANFRSAHLGGDLADGQLLNQVWDADFAVGEDTQYSVVYGGARKRLDDGFTKQVQPGELARIEAGMGVLAPGKTAWLSAIGSVTGISGFTSGRFVAAPTTQHLYVSAADNADWSLFADQLGDPLPNGWLPSETSYQIYFAKYAAGRTYGIPFNTGVHGPVLDGSRSITRSGDTLYAFQDVFADGAGHRGGSEGVTATTTLYRNGVKLAENDSEIAFESFPLPKEDAEYTLSTSQTRANRKMFQVATRIDASWTFRSKSGDKAAPVSVVRFHPAVDLESKVKAHRPLLMPVEIQGAAAAEGNLKSLTVEASYDGGRHWTKLPKVLGKYALLAPAAGKGVTLRAEVTDQQGNVSKVTVYDAFLGR